MARQDTSCQFKTVLRQVETRQERIESVCVWSSLRYLVFDMPLWCGVCFACHVSLTLTLTHNPNPGQKTVSGTMSASEEEAKPKKLTKVCFVLFSLVCCCLITYNLNLDPDSNRNNLNPEPLSIVKPDYNSNPKPLSIVKPTPYNLNPENPKL